MCFSSTASFTSAGVLTLAASALMIRNKNPRYFFLAIIPLFFAVQQLAEGFVWQDVNSQFWKNIYLFFALTFWPIYIPFSIYMADRFKWQLLFIGMGITLASVLAWAIPKGVAEHLNQSIHYPETELYNHPVFYPSLYMLITILPTFISPIKKMWAFGFIGLLSAIVVYVLDKSIFLSLWCFSAAIISLMLFFIIPRGDQDECRL